MTHEIPKPTLNCLHCGVGRLCKEDLPKDCPHCGVHLTKVVSTPPVWVQDIQRIEDREFLDELERMIAYTSVGIAIPDTPRERC